MRFMIIVKATKESEAGVMPSEKLLADMGKFNEELVNAGVMLAGEGSASHLERRTHQVLWQQAYGRRRAIHRDQRTDRRLLALEGEVERRGDRVGQALSESAQRR